MVLKIERSDKNQWKHNELSIPPARHRPSNIAFVRVMAAVWVMAGHMGPIRGDLETVLGGFGLHTLGVEALFLISGYLNAMSWRRDSHFGRYMTRRFLHLFIPYAVMVLVMVWGTGPLISQLGRDGYYQSWWRSFLDNLRFYIVFAQPGVFTDNPIPNVTNGSLWTMPVELFAYLLLPIAQSLLDTIRRRKNAFPFEAALTAALCLLNTWLYAHPEIRLAGSGIGPPDSAAVPTGGSWASLSDYDCDFSLYCVRCCVRS